MRRNKTSKMNKELTFRQYTSNIEHIPFSVSEARELLGVDTEEFNSNIRSGLIKKSVSIHYRFDQGFSFIGLFDLFEYSLRKEFFFLVYRNSPDVNELVCSLVDEVARVIDLQFIDGIEALTLGKILESIKHLCNESLETWRNYWLRNGERFSSEKCAFITLKTWCSLFDRSMSEIGVGDTVS